MEPEDLDPADAEVVVEAAPGGAPDLKALSEQLQALSEMIAGIQAQLPVDAGEERAEAVDEGVAEAEAQPPAAGGKASPNAKSAAVAELSKLLG